VPTGLEPLRAQLGGNVKPFGRSSKATRSASPMRIASPPKVAQEPGTLRHGTVADLLPRNRETGTTPGWLQ